MTFFTWHASYQCSVYQCSVFITINIIITVITNLIIIYVYFYVMFSAISCGVLISRKDEDWVLKGSFSYETQEKTFTTQDARNWTWYIIFNKKHTNTSWKKLETSINRENKKIPWKPIFYDIKLNSKNNNNNSINNNIKENSNNSGEGVREDKKESIFIGSKTSFSFFFLSGF